MIKVKQLLTLERFVSLTMAFLIGFWAGTYYSQTPALILALLVGICALAKIELHHWIRKLQKFPEQ